MKDKNNTSEVYLEGKCFLRTSTLTPLGLAMRQ